MNPQGQHRAHFTVQRWDEVRQSLRDVLDRCAAKIVRPWFLCSRFASCALSWTYSTISPWMASTIEMQRADSRLCSILFRPNVHEAGMPCYAWEILHNFWSENKRSACRQIHLPIGSFGGRILRSKTSKWTPQGVSRTPKELLGTHTVEDAQHPAKLRERPLTATLKPGLFAHSQQVQWFGENNLCRFTVSIVSNSCYNCDSIRVYNQYNSKKLLAIVKNRYSSIVKQLSFAQIKQLTAAIGSLGMTAPGACLVLGEYVGQPYGEEE